MYHVEGTVLTLGFMAFFLFLIPRMNFFRIENIPIRWFQGAFALKVLSGFLLYLIYTYYYTDRSTSDIWKYYDDAMVMYSTIHHAPADFFKMLFGIGNNAPHFEQYYDQMNHWYRPYGSSVANDTHTIIRFNAFVRLFSMGHYNVHSVVVNFLGLVGLTGILHFLKQMTPNKERWFFAGVFLMPGMMFWASGVLKEPLLLFGLGLFLHSVLHLTNDGFSVKNTVLVLLSICLLLTVKSYALAAIVLGLVAWILSRKFNGAHPAIWFAGVLVIGFLALIGLDKLAPEKSLFKRMAQRQYEFYQLAEGGTYIKTSANDTLYIGAKNYDDLEFVSDRKEVRFSNAVSAVYWKEAKKQKAVSTSLEVGKNYEVLLDYGKTGSTIDIPILEPNARSMLKAVPMALVNATFRPYPWKIRSPFMALSGLENIMILVLLILAVFKFQSEALRNPIFWVSVSFALIIIVLTGLVTPVVGAIVRYKVPALPFLVCSIVALTNTASIERYALGKFPSLKKYF